MADLVLQARAVVDAHGHRPDHGLWIRPDGTIGAGGPHTEVVEQARDATDEVTVREVDGVLAPGLINMHVHLGLALPGPMARAVDRGSDAEYVLLMADAARRTLRCGVTSVRLVGESRFLDMALRRAVRRGALDGPRIWTAGHALCCTGGHGWEADAVEADGADGFRRATREQLRAGADLVKVCISGGIAGEHESIDTPQLTDDEMTAVIGTAHAWGRQVTAHAGPADVILRGLELGLDGIEHGYELTQEAVDRMVATGAWYCPTITVSRCEQFFLDHEVPRWMIDRALGAGPRHWESLQLAISAGVQIVMGSDMPPYADYDGTSATVREMEFMQEAGMPPGAVLATATTQAARWLGTADTLGLLAAGHHADLVVLDADPAAGISAYRSVRAVLQGGRVVRDDRGELAGRLGSPAKSSRPAGDRR